MYFREEVRQLSWYRNPKNKLGIDFSTFKFKGLSIKVGECTNGLCCIEENHYRLATNNPNHYVTKKLLYKVLKTLNPTAS